MNIGEYKIAKRLSRSMDFLISIKCHQWHNKDIFLKPFNTSFAIGDNFFVFYLKVLDVPSSISG
jgi:hypothetical protein